jgi:CRP-like cAMP-binding protein
VHLFIRLAHPASPAKGFRQPSFAEQQEFAMGVPRRFAIPNDCLSCTLRQTGDFCNLPQPLMNEFNAMGHVTLYPGNATLLTEGQMPRGVYIACFGRAKLSVQARDGKTIILKIAGDRQVLGLSAVVSRGPP